MPRAMSRGVASGSVSPVAFSKFGTAPSSHRMNSSTNVLRRTKMKAISKSALTTLFLAALLSTSLVKADLIAVDRKEYPGKINPYPLMATKCQMSIQAFNPPDSGIVIGKQLSKIVIYDHATEQATIYSRNGASA